jgi:hypothetical protein
LPDKLPGGVDARVYTVDVSFELNDHLVDPTAPDNITRDIATAQEMRVDRLFVYNSTWNPRILPPTGEPIILGSGVKIILVADETTERDIVVDFLLPPSRYLVGIINVELTGVFPDIQSADDFNIEKIGVIEQSKSKKKKPKRLY